MLWVALYNQNEWFFKFYLLGPNGSPPCLIHAFVTLETKSMSFFSACESAPGDLFKAKIPLYSVHAKKAIHINYLSLKLIFYYAASCMYLLLWYWSKPALHGNPANLANIIPQSKLDRCWCFSTYHTGPLRASDDCNKKQMHMILFFNMPFHCYLICLAISNAIMPFEFKLAVICCIAITSVLPNVPIITLRWS